MLNSCNGNCEKGAQPVPLMDAGTPLRVQTPLYGPACGCSSGRWRGTARVVLGLLPFLLFALGGCASSPPSRTIDVCEIFEDKRGWHKAAQRSSQRYNISMGIIMATIYQESSFQGRARPPRTKILWVLPGPRASSAYGYSQALTGTWEMYKRNTGRHSAKRQRFSDAVDFVAWYHDRSVRVNKIDRNDAYHLYLAYHEGHGGFTRRTYQGKDWLLRAARNVAARSARYDRQYTECAERLSRHWWQIFSR